jgi:hypothetical protein
MVFFVEGVLMEAKNGGDQCWGIEYACNQWDKWTYIQEGSSFFPFGLKYSYDYACHLLFTTSKQGVCHIVASSFTLKSTLRQKNNYGNSNISPCKNIPNLQKILWKKPKSFKILYFYNLISSFNTSQNIISQKSSYKNR